MDPRVFDAKDSAVVADDKGAANALHDEARTWMSQRPEPMAKANGDRSNEKFSAKVEDPETPEVKAAYKNLLEKTKGVDPVAIADSINLFSDFAAIGGNVSKLAGSFENQNKQADAKDAKLNFSPEISVDANAVEPHVAGAYGRLLQRGFNPVIIKDVLDVAGDVAAIALSPQGRKLFEDVKTLINHITGG